MYETYVVSLGSNDPAVRILPPQAGESHKVLDNRDSPQQRSANTEDGVGGQLVSCQAVPHAKVHANGHEDAVDEDEQPEPENGLPARLQRVIERRRPSKVGVVVRDLRVRVDGVRVW